MMIGKSTESVYTHLPTEVKGPKGRLKFPSATPKEDPKMNELLSGFVTLNQ
jgi:hypothetical protein